MKEERGRAAAEVRPGAEELREVREETVSLRKPWWVAGVYSPMDEMNSPER